MEGLLCSRGLRRDKRCQDNVREDNHGKPSERFRRLRPLRPHQTIEGIWYQFIGNNLATTKFTRDLGETANKRWRTSATWPSLIPGARILGKLSLRVEGSKMLTIIQAQSPAHI